VPSDRLPCVLPYQAYQGGSKLELKHWAAVRKDGMTTLTRFLILRRYLAESSSDERVMCRMVGRIDDGAV